MTRIPSAFDMRKHDPVKSEADLRELAEKAPELACCRNTRIDEKNLSVSSTYKLTPLGNIKLTQGSDRMLGW